MAIAKLIQQHQRNLDEARKALERPRVGEQQLRLGDTLKQRRIAEVTARIAALESERRTTLERIDRAIAAEKDLLARLEAAAPLPQRPAPPKGPGRPEDDMPQRPDPAPIRGERRAGPSQRARRTRRNPKAD